MLHEQKPQKDIDLNLIRHAAISELFRPYQEALDSALNYADDHDGKIQPLDPALLQHLNQTWFPALSPGDPDRVERSIEVVRYSLAHSLAISITAPTPFMLAPSTMSEYTARLEVLGKQPS